VIWDFVWTDKQFPTKSQLLASSKCLDLAGVSENRVRVSLKTFPRPVWLPQRPHAGAVAPDESAGGMTKAQAPWSSYTVTKPRLTLTPYLTLEINFNSGLER
jgi:hypothetical protein